MPTGVPVIPSEERIWKRKEGTIFLEKWNFVLPKESWKNINMDYFKAEYWLTFFRIGVNHSYELITYQVTWKWTHFLSLQRMNWLWAKLDTYGVLVTRPEHRLPSGLQKSQAVHRTLSCFFSFQWKRIRFNYMKQFDNLCYREAVSLYKLRIQMCKIRRTSEKHNSISCII